MFLIPRMKGYPEDIYVPWCGSTKCINCVEHGLPLTVENVLKSSRLHKRCGTSFVPGYAGGYCAAFRVCTGAGLLDKTVPEDFLLWYR